MLNRGGRNSLNYPAYITTFFTFRQALRMIFCSVPGTFVNTARTRRITFCIISRRADAGSGRTPAGPARRTLFVPETACVNCEYYKKKRGIFS